MKCSRISVLKSIRKYIKPVKGSVLMLVLTSVAVLPLEMINPTFFKVLIDDVMAKQSFARFPYVAIGLLVVFGIRLLLDSASLGFSNRVLNSFTLHLREDVLNKLLKTPFRFLEKKESGDLKMRLMDDVDCLGNFIREQVSEVAFQFGLFVFALIMALRVNVVMTLLCLLVIPFVFLINYLIGRGTRKVNEEIRNVNQDYYTSTHNSLQFWREIKAQRAEDTFVARFAHYRQVLAKLGIRSIRYWAYNEVFNDFKANYLTNILVYVIGAFFVMGGKVSVGTLVMFSQYFAMVFCALDTLNSKRVSLRTNMPYYQRIFETLDFPEDAPEEAGDDAPGGFLEFENVSFAYQEGHPVFDHFSLQVEPGKTLALVGETGCGKTTLVKLLLGLYEPQGGRICCGGVELGSGSRRNFYRGVGIVMQDPYLFNMSIRENLMLNKQDATDEELWQACREAHLEDWLRTLPEGLDTVIGEHGVRLSGGQKQRIVIAGALLKQPQLLILDEATSSLDKQSEDSICQAIRQISGKRTVLEITHKPSLALEADKIAVMQEGNITAFGTPEELRRTNLYFQRMVVTENEKQGKSIHHGTLQIS